MKLLLLLAGLGSMKAAIERHDVDEATRQGVLAGPTVVGRALASADRTEQLAGIAAAARVEDRAELLPALARLADGPDRRTAIPAAHAAVAIARELGRHELPDDLVAEDLAAWRDTWLALATRGDRWVELRIAAIEVAAALGDVPLSTDPDPALRVAAIELLPSPISAAVRDQLATAAKDPDERVARAAAKVLCTEDASTCTK